MNNLLDEFFLRGNGTKLETFLLSHFGTGMITENNEERVVMTSYLLDKSIVTTTYNKNAFSYEIDLNPEYSPTANNAFNIRGHFTIQNIDGTANLKSEEYDEITLNGNTLPPQITTAEAMLYDIMRRQNTSDPNAHLEELKIRSLRIS